MLPHSMALGNINAWKNSHNVNALGLMFLIHFKFTWLFWIFFYGYHASLKYAIFKFCWFMIVLKTFCCYIFYITSFLEVMDDISFGFEILMICWFVILYDRYMKTCFNQTFNTYRNIFFLWIEVFYSALTLCWWKNHDWKKLTLRSDAE